MDQLSHEVLVAMIEDPAAPLECAVRGRTVRDMMAFDIDVGRLLSVPVSNSTR